MEFFTFDRLFQKSEVIDTFTSAIWTVRYYGDDEFEIVLPLSMDNIRMLAVGTFIGLVGSDRPMIVETMSVEKNLLKVKGISLPPWLNNRILRKSNKHEDRYWYLSGQPAGQALWTMIYNMCSYDSPFVQGWYDYGIGHAHQLGITGLTLGRYDTSGPNVDLAIPYGPLYDALRQVAEGYGIGMRILLSYTTDKSYYVMDSGIFNSGGYTNPGYFLEFTSYKGVDRTSSQTTYPAVRFSPQFDSLTDIKEMQSASGQKTVVYVFAPSNPGGLATGMAAAAARSYNQWENTDGTRRDLWWADVRALMVFADDITTDQVGTSAANLKAVLNARATTELKARPFLIAVDGEIVPGNQFKYGVDYGLGDIIEVQGNSGAISAAMVTEFIRSQDSNGERSYPTVVSLTPSN